MKRRDRTLSPGEYQEIVDHMTLITHSYDQIYFILVKHFRESDRLMRVFRRQDPINVDSALSKFKLMLEQYDSRSEEEKNRAYSQYDSERPPYESPARERAL